ncbi:MAG: right-handed parallel beta-helix repeat-containing protein, partial [Desulfobacteraceae bacterium]|nr:right-handed parallel beta-helix repeat-containing protein [Desulfobacteraceae bacterium]
MKANFIGFFTKAALVFVAVLFIISIFGIKLADSAETIYYVAGHGSDAHNGLSPEAPFQTIQHAIDTANGSISAPVTIRIAAGIYNEQIVMDSHESLQGGWDTFFSARRDFTDSNFDSDPTASSIVDGESFRRCIVLNNVERIKINGLTIQHGWSDDGSEQSDIWDDTGAGVNCIESSVSFYNCSFLENLAFSSGSGLHSIDSWVRVNGCRFDSNLCDSGGGDGGALYHSGGTLKAENSDFTYNEAYYNDVGAIFNDSDDGWIKGCRFSHNGSIRVGGVGIESGAALMNTGPTAFIANCIFEHNHAEHFGAMRNWGSNVTIINCLFFDNTTEEGWPGGGALQNVNSNVSVYNSTFIDNLEYLADISGGHIGNFSSSLEVFNSIFWFHEDWLNQLFPWENMPPAILNSDSTSIVSHCIIGDDDFRGVGGNIWSDPLFIGNNNFRLQAESPCIDAGSGELSMLPDTADIDNDGNKTEPMPIDLDGHSRISGSIVDIGAYEYVHPTGSLKVTIDPSAARSAGARWRVDGGTWRNSGATQGNIAVGNHIVEYKAISDWSTPGNQIVTIDNNQNTQTTGIYTTEMGSLTVTLSPTNAVSAGAQWRVDGGVWHNSG